MDTQKYNGWTNRATWAVNLYLNDTAERQAAWLDEARRALKAAPDDETMGEMVRDGRLPAADVATCTVRDALESALRDGVPDIHTTDSDTERLYSDLLTCAIGEVEFREIAEHFVQAALDATS